MFLCIDQGGQTSRAIVYSRSGQVLAQAARAVETSRPGPLLVEHDPEAILRSVTEVINEVTGIHGVPPEQIRAAGLATQRSSLVCVDRLTGEPLTCVLSWQDRRGSDWLEKFAASGQQIKQRTGLPLSPHYGVSKIAWCLENVCKVRKSAAAGRLVAAPLASFLLHGLLRARPWVVDPANASRTLLMNTHTLDWDATLLDLFGIPASILPQITATRHSYGVLHQQQIPMQISNGDQSAAVFAWGEPVPGMAFVNMGTGAFIQAVTGDAPVQDDALLSSIVAARAGRHLYVLEGTVNGAASAVELAREELGLPQAAFSATAAGWLEKLDPQVCYLNGVGGLGSPDWVADFPSRFVGEGSDPERIVAVYESIIFLIMRNFERMGTRLAISRIVASGGLSRLDSLCQRLADLSGLAVDRPPDEEATAGGIGTLLGMTPARTSAVHFQPQPNPALAARYQRWTRLMTSSLAGNSEHPDLR
jgi:glycerol kinase